MHTIAGERSHLWSRGPEAILAIGLIAEGRKIGAYDTLVNAGTTRTYAVLAELVDNIAWGVFGVTIGTLWLVALVLNGTFPRFRRISPWARGASALVAMFYWSVFAFGMQRANDASIGFEAHAILAALAVFLAIRVGRREIGIMEGEIERCRLR